MAPLLRSQELWYNGEQLAVSGSATLGGSGVVAGGTVTVLTTREHDTSEAAVAALFTETDATPRQWQSVQVPNPYPNP